MKKILILGLLLLAAPALAQGPNNPGVVGARQSGAWTMQPGNTPNTVPWLFTIQQGGNPATVSAAGALKVDGSAVTQPVSGTFWQATQPVSLASTTITGTVAVTGTFWQATQPVSVASLPALPANQSVNIAQIGATAVVADPCQAVTKTYTPISITTATTTRIVAPTTAKRTYICQLFITAAAADNIGIVEGTGGTCGSSTAGVIGGTTAANGPNFAANGGVSLGNGGYAVAATAGTNVDLCLITSAATPLAGSIAWVQQ